jgi:hypothetical protein
VYLFFSQAELRATLDSLARVLAIGWVVVIAGSALVGTAVARRTLRPVREAAAAASGGAD